MALPQTTIEKIKADAAKATDKRDEKLRDGSKDYGRRISFLDGYEEGHVAGATEWAGKAQEKEAWYLKRIQSLRDTLEQIIHAPVPANDREYMSWFVAAKNIAGGAISDDDAEVEVAKYKEVANEC